MSAGMVNEWLRFGWFAVALLIVLVVGGYGTRQAPAWARQIDRAVLALIAFRLWAVPAFDLDPSWWGIAAWAVVVAGEAALLVAIWRDLGREESQGRVRHELAAERQEAAADRSEGAADRAEVAADRMEHTAGRGEDTADRGETTADRGETTADRGEVASERTEGSVDRLESVVDRVATGARGAGGPSGRGNP